MSSAKSTNTRFWGWWLLGSLLLGGWLAWAMFGEGDKTVLMPGPMTDGHYQIAEQCDVCHSDPLGGGEVLQQACIDCHGDVREKPHDSHPRSKFTDPRNADRLEKINAVECVSCHVEHRPEITLENGLTQPLDVCAHCHMDVAEERPSHAGMPMDSCKDSGCHNFHNNRALYTDFLVKHLADTDISERPWVKRREFADVLEEILEYPRDRYPLEALTSVDSELAPGDMSHDDFLATKHAQAGVNCSACHQPLDANGEQLAWRDDPGIDGCTSCHNIEAQQFKKGKHGMRLAAGLSPMQPAMARLPMKPGKDVAHQELTCTACHGAHDFNPQKAAVDGCLNCHADQHSAAYSDSPHADLWRAELLGDAREGSGVSCATCHMPRVEVDVNDWMSRIAVQHNQNANLSPNSKMIRNACLHCHGLGFSINALADRALIDANFKGQPGVQVESMDMAHKDNERYLRELEESGR